MKKSNSSHKFIRIVLSFFTVIFTVLFLFLFTINSVVYDQGFITGIPNDAFMEAACRNVADRLAKESLFYGVPEDVLRSMVDKNAVRKATSEYFSDVYRILNIPGFEPSESVFPSEGYYEQLSKYIEENAGAHQTVNEGAVRNVADEMAAITLAEVRSINNKTLTTIARFTSSSLLKKLANLFFIFGILAIGLAVLNIAIKGASLESRMMLGSATVFLPSLAYLILFILFSAYGFKEHLVLAESSMKLFVDALIDRIFTSGIIIAAILTVVSGLVFVIMLVKRIGKRKKEFFDSDHHHYHHSEETRKKRFTRSTWELILPYLSVLIATVLVSLFVYSFTIQTSVVKLVAGINLGNGMVGESSVSEPIIISYEEAAQKAGLEFPVIGYRDQWATLNIDGWSTRDIPVFYANVDDNDALAAGAVTPGYSEFCGRGGRITMAAHVTTDFYEIEDTQVGTKVHVATTYGNYEYVVDDIVVFDYQDLTYVEPNRDKEELVIYTCYPRENGFDLKTERIALICSYVSGTKYR